MKFDANGLIMMEQDTFPGSIGDSCAETSRYATLDKLLNSPASAQLTLFITSGGVVRYPSPPSPWGASDTSSDQVAPLIAACSLTDPPLADEILSLIKDSGYRTGNGTFINPGMWAQMMRHQGSRVQWLWDLSVLGQAMIFKLPFAWNPNASANPNSWFVSSANQTSGYLNFINFLAFAKAKKWTWPCRLAVKVIGQKKALNQVVTYYKPEPNSAWLLNTYAIAVAKIWG
jgi:hypothetical protein